jgi:hypothetical protein
MRIATTALLRLYISSSFSQTLLSLLSLNSFFQNLGSTTNFSHSPTTPPPQLSHPRNIMPAHTLGSIWSSERIYPGEYLYIPWGVSEGSIFPRGLITLTQVSNPTQSTIYWWHWIYHFVRKWKPLALIYKGNLGVGTILPCYIGVRVKILFSQSSTFNRCHHETHNPWHSYRRGRWPNVGLFLVL